MAELASETMKTTGSMSPSISSGKMMSDKATTRHEMYSLSDITEALHHEFEDEIAGANEYLDMATSAREMHHMELAHYLCAMAKDEYSHASFISHHMKKSGVEVSEKTRKEWEELEERFRRAFS